MEGYTYLGENTLSYDKEKCIGCGMCLLVCPHTVFAMGEEKKVAVVRGDDCMECGACALNCPVSAIEVSAGVGCASAILHSWIKGGEPSCDCSGGSSCC